MGFNSAFKGLNRRMGPLNATQPRERPFCLALNHLLFLFHAVWSIQLIQRR